MMGKVLLDYDYNREDLTERVLDIIRKKRSFEQDNTNGKVVA